MKKQDVISKTNFLKFLTMFLYVVSVSTLFVGCTREAINNSSTVSITLPAVENPLALSNVSAACEGDGDGGDEEWNTTDPTSISEINCYAVFVERIGQSDSSCGNKNSTTGVYSKKFNFEKFKGFIPATAAPQKINMAIPSGGSARVWLAGVKAGSGACKPINESQCDEPDFANLTVPMILGRSQEVELAPFTTQTPIIETEFDLNDRFEDCSFIEDDRGEHSELEVTGHTDIKQDQIYKYYVTTGPPVNAAMNITLTLDNTNASFCASDSSCVSTDDLGQSTTVHFAANDSTGYFYVSNSNASNFKITASATGYNSDDFNIVTNPVGDNQLFFPNGDGSYNEQGGTVGNCKKLILESTADPGSTISLNLSSNRGAFYGMADSSCTGTAITTLNIDSANWYGLANYFYYKPTSDGTSIISVDCNGCSDFADTSYTMSFGPQ